MTMKSYEEIEARKLRQAQAKEGDQVEDEETVDDDQPPADDPSMADDTDELSEAREQIAQLQQQMSALQGRLTPMQQQNEEYRRLYASEHEQRERERQELESRLAEAQSKLEQADAQLDFRSILSEEERELFDEEQLSAFSKIASSIAKRHAPKVDVRGETLRVLDEQRQKAVADHRDSLLRDPQRGLADLSTLANDRKFQTWIGQDENADFDSLVSSFLNATTEREVDQLGKALARRVAKFKESNPGRKPDSKTRTRRMQRQPAERSEEEMRGQLMEAKRLARSSNAKDREKAKEILDALS